MDPATILLISRVIKASIVAACVVVYYWKDILAFLNGPMRNFIGKTFGKVWSDRFAKFVVWLDKVMMRVRETVPVQKFLPNFLKRKHEISGTTTKRTVTQIKLPYEAPVKEKVPTVRKKIKQTQ